MKNDLPQTPGMTKPKNPDYEMSHTSKYSSLFVVYKTTTDLLSTFAAPFSPLLLQWLLRMSSGKQAS